MKVFCSLVSLFLPMLVHASTVITDQGLTPKCTAYAQALAADQAGSDPGQASLVDIYLVDMSTLDNPHQNDSVLVEEYIFANLPGRPVFTEFGKITTTNPNGSCHAFQIN